MASKTLQQTATQADVQAADIIAIARGTGSLSHSPITALVTYLQTIFAPIAAPSFTGGASVAGGLTVSSGGASVTGGATVTGGVVQSGATVQSVNAVGAAIIDWSAQDWHTKSISANTTFSFSGITAAKAQGIILDLTITSAAIPTWPGSVKWSGGATPTLGNGRHFLGFITDDGGTSVVGVVGALAVA